MPGVAAKSDMERPGIRTQLEQVACQAELMLRRSLQESI